MKLDACFIIILLSFFSSVVRAQSLLTTVDSYTGDTIISTGFDTLKAVKKGSRNSAPDRVVAVETVHKGKSTYWLFFYFSTSDITDKPVKISNRNYAYFIKTNNEYLRMHYNGKALNYSGKDNAGFFIDITNYLNQLKRADIKIIRLETSQLYHEIILPEEKMGTVAQLVSRLTNRL